MLTVCLLLTHLDHSRYEYYLPTTPIKIYSTKRKDTLSTNIGTNLSLGTMICHKLDCSFIGTHHHQSHHSKNYSPQPGSSIHHKLDLFSNLTIILPPKSIDLPYRHDLGVCNSKLILINYSLLRDRQTHTPNTYKTLIGLEDQNTLTSYNLSILTDNQTSIKSAAGREDLNTLTHYNIPILNHIDNITLKLILNNKLPLLLLTFLDTTRQLPLSRRTTQHRVAQPHPTANTLNTYHSHTPRGVCSLCSRRTI